MVDRTRSQRTQIVYKDENRSLSRYGTAGVEGTMQSKLVLVTCILASIWGVSVCSPAQGDGDGDVDADADGDSDGGCVEGLWRCSGIAYQECHDGVWDNADCNGVCVEDIGCAACTPEERYCDGNNLMECNDEGTGGDLVMDCTTEEGYICSGGSCTNACEKAVTTRSNVGCEYWAVDLDNAENSLKMPGMPDIGDRAAAAQFAVAVANTDLNLSAHVTVEINSAPQGEPLDLEVVAEVDVARSSLEVLELPRRDADGDNVTDHVDDGPQTWLSSRAFKIKSTAPVVAYQFNTINQMFSNDASLLLPKSGLDNHHIVLGYPPNAPIAGLGSPKNRSYLTVLGTAENTLVKVTPSYKIMEGEGVPELVENVEYEFVLGPFDVLNLETPLLTLQQVMGGAKLPDLTGSIVESDNPVAVFFGNDLTSIAPIGATSEGTVCCAEHIESQILPTSAMGKRFIVTRSPQRSRSTPEVDVYRVLAAVDETEVTTTLSGTEASFSLNAGEFFAFNSAEPFVLDSTQPVHVGQFLINQEWIEDHYTGDSSFLMFPAFEQWRGTYIFTTGRGFSEDYAVLAVPDSATVTLDGADVFSPFCNDPIDIGDVEGAHYVQVVCPIEDGVHVVDSGDISVGVTAYGYYSAGSYAYSAGSELNQIFLY